MEVNTILFYFLVISIILNEVGQKGIQGLSRFLSPSQSIVIQNEYLNLRVSFALYYLAISTPAFGFVYVNMRCRGQNIISMLVI